VTSERGGGAAGDATAGLHKWVGSFEKLKVCGYNQVRSETKVTMRVAMRFAGFMLALAILRGEQLPTRIYTTAEGLPNNTIDRIVPDSRGFVWFCTRDGISCFDGYGFRTFGTAQGLATLPNDILETAGGDYWIATAKGLAHFRPSSTNPQFDYYRADAPKAQKLNAIASDPAGGIWVGTEGGLYHLDRVPAGRRLRFVDIGMPGRAWEDTFVNVLLTDRDGTLWAGTGSGLYRRLPDGRSMHLRIDMTRPYVISLLKDRQGTVWVGTRSGLCRIPPSGSKKTLKDVCVLVPDFKGQVIEGLLESRAGEIWVATWDRLAIYRNTAGQQRLESYTIGKQLPGHGPITTLGEDQSGNVWVGAHGAERIAAGGFRSYTQEDGLGSNHILSILETKRGELCAVTQGSEARPVNCFDGSRFHSARPHVPAAIRDWGWSANRLTFQSRGGEWWVPTGRGVFRFPSGGINTLFSRSPTALYAPGERVFAIFEDSRGSVWVSTQVSSRTGGVLANRLSRWDKSNGILKPYPDNNPVPAQVLATAFAEDHAGNVWIGLSSGGLVRYSGKGFQTFLDKDVDAGWVSDLYVDHAGRLWASTTAGLHRMDDPDSPAPRIIDYTSANGLSTDRIRCITEDLEGRIYLGSDLGIDRFRPDDSTLQVRHFTAADGLAPGDVLSAFRDREGSLWFGTRQGLSRLDPGAERKPSPPPVFISGMRVRGAPLAIPFLGANSLSGIELPYDRNQVELQFVGPGYEASGSLRYQYRLEDSDPDWSAATEERVVNYANLAPGAYQWHVRAVTPDGAIGAPATAVFTILPPVWQRWWARLLLVLTALALFYSFYRYRLTSLLQVERLRTRIATDLHDDIGSSLSQIALLSEVARRQPGGLDSAEPLTGIADLSRELVDSMSDIVWAIDPDQDRVGDLAHRMRRFAADLFTRDGLELRLDMPGDGHDFPIGADVRRQVFLVFKESLHNALRHSGCTRVDVQFRSDAGFLKLRIADNGSGFDPRSAGRGHGLASMRARAIELGGDLTVNSSLGQGTTIELRVPVTKPSSFIRKSFPHKWVVNSWLIRRMVRQRDQI
jgi:ligand-binding sensor domain-containing protein/signal transduction histidine kinase